jgi:hypothetical protein
MSATEERNENIRVGRHNPYRETAAVLVSVTYGVMYKETKIPVLIVRR